jgi:hypothetical protein
MGCSVGSQDSGSTARGELIEFFVEVVGLMERSRALVISLIFTGGMRRMRDMGDAKEEEGEEVE